MTPATRVFVSYSQESAEHSAWVLALADRLRGDGVDAWVDRYVQAPADGWPRWIRRQIEEADFVLCVCTPTYRRAFEGRSDPERGLGVNNEGYIIQQDLYDRGNVSERYIPVLTGWSITGVPGALRGFTRYRVPDEYHELHQRLTRSGAELAPPLSPLPARNARGFEAKSEIGEYLRPEAYPLQRLAPVDGLFVSRLINPLDTLHPETVMTIWVASRGDLQYILDSARIYNEWQGGAGPLAEVTIPPDAAYRFTYADHSDREYALNPALTIGPQTRRMASFTLALAPDKPLYGFSRLWIWIRYHASDGRRGTLLLREPPRSGKAIARLVGEEVLVTRDVTGGVVETVVTPDGLQRGVEEGYEPPLQLTLLENPDLPEYRRLSRADLLAHRSWCRERLARRHALNQRLGTDEGRAGLAALFDRGERWAADVLGGLADEPSTAILRARFADSPIAVKGLCVRHLARPDDQLAAHVVAHHDELDDDTLWTVASALLVAPAGDWVAAFDVLDTEDVIEWPEVLALLRADLSPQAWQQLVDHVGGPLGGRLYVRGSMHDWVNPPPQESRLEYLGGDRYRATLALPPAVHQFKIAEVDWPRSANWGGQEPGGTVTLDLPHALTTHALSHNLQLDLSAEPAPGSYRVEVDATDLDRPTVVVSRA